MEKPRHLKARTPLTHHSEQNKKEKSPVLLHCLQFMCAAYYFMWTEFLYKKRALLYSYYYLMKKINVFEKLKLKK